MYMEIRLIFGYWPPWLIKILEFLRVIYITFAYLLLNLWKSYAQIFRVCSYRPLVVHLAIIKISRKLISLYFYSEWFFLVKFLGCLFIFFIFHQCLSRFSSNFQGVFLILCVLNLLWLSCQLCPSEADLKLLLVLHIYLIVYAKFMGQQLLNCWIDWA